MDNSKHTADGQTLAYQCGLAVGEKHGASTGFWKGVLVATVGWGIGMLVITAMSDSE